MEDDVNKNERYINLSDVEGISHTELFAMVSNVIAEDTQHYIN